MWFAFVVQAPVPVLGVQREMSVPGGAANVLRNVTALGVSAAFGQPLGHGADQLAVIIAPDHLKAGHPPVSQSVAVVIDRSALRTLAHWGSPDYSW